MNISNTTHYDRVVAYDLTKYLGMCVWVYWIGLSVYYHTYEIPPLRKQLSAYFAMALSFAFLTVSFTLFAMCSVDLDHCHEALIPGVEVDNYMPWDPWLVFVSTTWLGALLVILLSLAAVQGFLPDSFFRTFVIIFAFEFACTLATLVMGFPVTHAEGFFKSLFPVVVVKYVATYLWPPLVLGLISGYNALYQIRTDAPAVTFDNVIITLTFPGVVALILTNIAIAYYMVCILLFSYSGPFPVGLVIPWFCSEALLLWALGTIIYFILISHETHLRCQFAKVLQKVCTFVPLEYESDKPDYMEETEDDNNSEGTTGSG